MWSKIWSTWFTLDNQSLKIPHVVRETWLCPEGASLLHCAPSLLLIYLQLWRFNFRPSQSAKAILLMEANSIFYMRIWVGSLKGVLFRPIHYWINLFISIFCHIMCNDWAPFYLDTYIYENLKNVKFKEKYCNHHSIH